MLCPLDTLFMFPYNVYILFFTDKYVAADLIKKMISNNCNLRYIMA